MMVMKMAVVSTGLLLPLLSVIVTSADSQCDHYVATKQDFTLLLDYVPKDSERLRWMHDKNVIFDRIGSKVSKGSVDDAFQNGSLRLRNVDKSKSGKYTPFVYEEGEAKGNFKSIKLCVMDPVPQPQVTNECIKANVKFTCKLSQTLKGVTFEWLWNDKVMPNEKSQTLTKPLQEVENVEFKCRVLHKVNSPFSDPFRQNCIQSQAPDKEKGGFLEMIFTGNNMWIIAGVGGGLVLLLMIIIIIFCIKNKRKKHRQVKEEEELRLDWSNSNPQHNQDQPPKHHHHHHHPPHHPPHQHPHRQQQPAGHTAPRQHRSKQPCTHRQNQDPQAPQVPSHQPQPGTRTRRATPSPRPPGENDEEQRPPLPQPRRKVQKKAPNVPRE